MSDDILKEAQEAFRECQEHEAENRREFEKDIRFARLEEQWPENEYKDRFGDDPRLTINKLAPVIRQVVNDARQNKPAITVRPFDSGADPATAEVMSDLIRHIESSSDADVAYDTAVDNAVSGGFGYFRINLRYACDDNWDQDIAIERVMNPLSVYGDPYSTAADSSDWNSAFVTEMLPKKVFEKRYKGADEFDWSAGDWPEHWREGDQIMVAEYWTRSEVKKQIYLMSDGTTISADDLKKRAEELYAAGIMPVGEPRDVMSYDVKQHILSGVEELEKTDWAGKYIPIVPVYGDEVVIGNKRHFRSLIRSAIDAQRMYNYWASKTTAVVALSPRMPFVGEEGAFDVDSNWDRVNDENLPYLEHKKGSPPPQRQPFTGVPTGMMQEMMNAAEHIKAVTGIHDASLGAKSNETSGRAIMARQREGDVSTFHFIDNLSRAIRHGGRILIDLIPKVYNSERVIRVLGADGEPRAVPLNQPVEERDEKGQPITRIYDLTAGKYDLAVEAGPSFTTRREEAATQMIELIQAYPDAAPLIGDLIAKNLDWPGADEVAKRLKAMVPPQALGEEGAQIPPEVQQQIEQGMQVIQQLQAENAELKNERQVKMMELQLKDREMSLKDREMGIKEFEAETSRIQATKPEFVPSGLAA